MAAPEPKLGNEMKKSSLFFLLAALAAGAAAQESAAPPDAPQVVYVAASKDPEWKTYAAFAAGLELHEQLRHLAPQAPLRFILRPQRRDASYAGVTLQLKGDTTSIPVPIAPDGTFALPYSEAALADNAELMLNRKKGTFRWRPDIHSPGVPDNARRLGDLRLECEVRWAIEQHELPYLMRKVFNAAGGPCHSASIKVDFLSGRPIAAMRLVAPGRRVALPAALIEHEGRIFMPPLHETSWPDDALVEFDYAD